MALATVAVLLALVVAALEGTVVTTAMPTITRELGDVTLYGWVFSAYLVANAVSVLVCGKLADSVGRKPTFTIATLLFIVGSVLSASANSVPVLIACRVIQGLGAGGIQPVAMTVTTDLYSLRERARIQGLLTAVWGAANILGPILGGVIVAKTSWRWVFLAPAPFAVLALLVLLFSYSEVAFPKKRATGIPGALLAGLCVSLILVSLEPRFPHRGAAAAFGALSCVVFAFTQSRSPAPLVPRSVLFDRVVASGLLSGVFAGAVLYLSLAYVPLWMIERSKLGGSFAGAPLICVLGGWAVGSTFGVRLLLARGMRWSIGGGYLLAFVAAVAVVYASQLPNTALVMVALVGLGLGLGPAASTSLVAPQNSVIPELRGTITSACYASRMLGGSVAIGVLVAFAPPEGQWYFAFRAIAVLAGVGCLTLTFAAPSQKLVSRA